MLLRCRFAGRITFLCFHHSFAPFLHPPFSLLTSVSQVAQPQCFYVALKNAWNRIVSHRGSPSTPSAPQQSQLMSSKDWWWLKRIIKGCDWSLFCPGDAQSGNPKRSIHFLCSVRRALPALLSSALPDVPSLNFVHVSIHSLRNAGFFKI